MDLLRDEVQLPLHKYCGVVMNKNKQNNCFYTLHDRNIRGVDNMYDSCFFRSNTCASTVSGDDIICAECNESVKALKRICERSVKNRDDDTEKDVKFTNDRFLQGSPSRQQGKVTRVAKERSNESKKRWAVKKHT